MEREENEREQEAEEREQQELRELRQKAVRWLERKDSGEPMVCPLCKSAEWAIGDPSRLPVHGSGDSQYPLIPVVCSTCGLFMFFHEGIIDRLEKEDEPLEAQQALEQADISALQDEDDAVEPREEIADE